MKARFTFVVVVWAAVIVLPASGWAQQTMTRSRSGCRPSPRAARRDRCDGRFRRAAGAGPLGPPPCVQSGTGIGGPADPCAYLLHHLTPEEVTVSKGGQVTFQIHGGGHGLAIYEVSKKTNREDLGQFLCAGTDPATLVDPLAHTCNLLAPTPTPSTSSSTPSTTW